MVGAFDNFIFAPNASCELVVIEKCLKEDRVRSAVEQSGDLFVKDHGTIDTARLRLIGADAEGADASGHTYIFSFYGLLRQPGGAAFISCVLSPKPNRSSRTRLAPNVLVSMTRAPAAT
jgi:hypothetical protein